MRCTNGRTYMYKYREFVFNTSSGYFVCNDHLWLPFRVICEDVCFHCDHYLCHCSLVSYSCVESTNVGKSRTMKIRNYIRHIWSVSCQVAYLLLIYATHLWFLITLSYLFICSLLNEAVSNSVLRYVIQILSNLVIGRLKRSLTSVQVAILRNAVPCCFIDGYQRFEKTCCFHLPWKESSLVYCKYLITRPVCKDISSQKPPNLNTLH
jgi:hypothetical protein